MGGGEHQNTDKAALECSAVHAHGGRYIAPRYRPASTHTHRDPVSQPLAIRPSAGFVVAPPLKHKGSSGLGSVLEIVRVHLSLTQKRMDATGG